MLRHSIYLFLTIILLHACGVAGTNGILEGVVKDRNSGEPLPGVNVLLVDLQQGTTTDADGRYQLPNIRAGSYQIRFSLIGYQAHLIKNVLVNPDLRTRLNIDLEQSAIDMDEVVVVQEKPLIQKDVTGTMFIVTAGDVESLPVDQVIEVIRLKPGVTLEGNVRGGKSTEVVYLVDGLPIQDVIGGGAASNLPNSSVFGASIYTGGFEPEYGNALSGVVNIVTRMGGNEHKFTGRVDKDNPFGGTQNNRTTEFEVSANGPVMENELYYVGAFNGLFTDTRWWQDFQLFFNGPIEKNLSGFGKLDYLFSPTLRVGGQVLYNRRDWRDYEFGWRLNLDGLPPQTRESYRLAVILSQSMDENFFYTASLSRFFLQSHIGPEARADIPANDPYQYDFFLRYVIDGQRAWWSETEQTTYTAKFDGTMKAGEKHLVKFGAEFNLYDLNSAVVKYEPRKTFFGKPLINEPQLNFSTSYRYKPRSGSLYVQDKIDLLKEGILVNVGLRYDFLDPTATRPAIESIPVTDSAFVNVGRAEEKASLKHQLSPRLGAAMQLSERSYMFVNLGWYFQYPLFEYLYTGLDRVTLAKGASAITGNPNLEPERVLAYEVSLKYEFGNDIVGTVTYFRKETTNLIDSKAFVSGNSRVAGSYGFAEYVNNPYAEAKGVEVVLSKERASWIQGELSYTFMATEGTSGSASDGFFVAQYGLPPAVRVYPLSWDQRHTLKLTTTVTGPWGLSVTGYGEFHSGRPYTEYPTATGFEPVDGGRFRVNNARMDSYLNVDLKARWRAPLEWNTGVLSAYLEVRNLLNERNVKWVDSNGLIGGELGDPSGYYMGRRTTLGAQVEF